MSSDIESQKVTMLFIHGDSDGWAAMNSVKAWVKMRSMGIQTVS